MIRQVALAAAVGRHRLKVHREIHVGNAAAGQRLAASEIGDVANVFRPHDARAVDGDVLEHLIEVHVLLRVGVDEIVEMMAR